MKKREHSSGWIREMQLLWAWGGWEAADGRDRFYAIQDRVETFYMKEAEKFMVEMGARRRLLEERPSKYFFCYCKEAAAEESYRGVKGREWICYSYG